jgi:hypothetical protein
MQKPMIWHCAMEKLITGFLMFLQKNDDCPVGTHLLVSQTIRRFHRLQAVHHDPITPGAWLVGVPFRSKINLKPKEQPCCRSSPFASTNPKYVYTCIHIYNIYI